MDHKCPSYCHRCPRMKDGDIMPGCMGGAVYNDMSRCTCIRPSRREQTNMVELSSRVDAIESFLQRFPDWVKLAHAINHATSEQQAQAMTRLTPEQEEIARRFEDAGR